MKTETPIAQVIRTAAEPILPAENSESVDDNQKTRFDAVCKRILALKIFLAWIMKSCLAEYKGCDVKEIAERYIESEPEIGKTPVLPDENIFINGAANEDTYTKEGTVVYDIRFYATAPRRKRPIRLIVNVEAQSKWNPGYPLLMRGLFYCCRMISAQYNREFTKSHYEKIKKVVSIWVCKNPTKKWRNTINRYRIMEEPLVGKAKENPRHYDLLSVVIIGLGRKKDKNYAGVLELLEVLLSTNRSIEEQEQILQNKFGITMTAELKEEVREMCNLAQGIEDRAIAKGINIGIEQGIKRGIERGIEKGIEKGIERGIEQGKFAERLANIQSLITTLRLTAEQAMDALNIPQEEREQYLPQLKHLN